MGYSLEAIGVRYFPGELEMMYGLDTWGVDVGEVYQYPQSAIDRLEGQLFECRAYFVECFCAEEAEWGVYIDPESIMLRFKLSPTKKAVENNYSRVKIEVIDGGTLLFSFNIGVNQDLDFGYICDKVKQSLLSKKNPESTKRRRFVA